MVVLQSARNYNVDSKPELFKTKIGNFYGY